jgi:membrane fusion protein (multidrug efflux system)
MKLPVDEIKINMNATEPMNAATLNQENPVSFRALTPALPPNQRPVSEPAAPQSAVASEPAPESGAPRQRNRLRHLAAGVAMLAVGLAAGTYYLEDVAPYESTDDAFIEAHVTPVAPQVAGRVAQLVVQDNQEVKAGDVLVQIDPNDFQTKLDQERANLAASRSRLRQANAQFTVDQAKVEQEKANVIAAQAEATQAEADNRRYQAVGNLAVSDSQLDLAATQARSAAAQVDAARNKELAAEAQSALDQAAIQTATAEVLGSQAAVHQAELNLSYTRVKAPEAGFVTHRTVETGAYVQTGQTLLALVPRQVWIVANFKETQLTDMRDGQPVTVTMDAYPQIKFKAHVDSIQSGTGPRFSLLPPENASGNYVKVVQRVPVKIVLDDAAAANYVLGPGMSVVPEVRVK